MSARLGVAVLVSAALVAAARRVRHGWRWRAGLVALAAIAAGANVWSTGNADPAIRAVEAFHGVEYRVIALAALAGPVERP